MKLTDRDKWNPLINYLKNSNWLFSSKFRTFCAYGMKHTNRYGFYFYSDLDSNFTALDSEDVITAAVLLGNRLATGGNSYRIYHR